MHGTTLPSYVIASLPSVIALAERCPAFPMGLACGLHKNDEPRPALFDAAVEIASTPSPRKSSTVASTPSTLSDSTTTEHRIGRPRATTRAIAARVRR